MADAGTSTPLFFRDDDLLGLADDDVRALVGGKACGLFALKRLGLSVPSFVVIPAGHVDAFADQQPAIAHAVAQMAHWLAGDDDINAVLLAIRSSGLDEDGADVSFAGVHETVLGVPAADAAAIANAVAVCRESFVAHRAQRYREQQHLCPARGGAVVVQRLILPRCAGVAFSRDPQGAAGAGDAVVVSACLGLGEGVVADRAESDYFVVSNTVVVNRHVVDKAHAVFVADGRSVVIDADATRRHAPSLTDGELCTLAREVRQMEVALGTPVDVEWALSSTGFSFLQVRPLTALPASTAVATTTPRYLFDNSNIAESYPGVTSPLTFSHIRDAYAVAYAESARIAGVSDDELSAVQRALSTMLSRIDGRVHYHLPSWFSVLALFPGYEQNRAHMIAMMGADDASPEALALVPPPPKRTVWRRLQMGLRMGARFAGRHRAVAEFSSSFAAFIMPLEDADVDAMDPDDVVALFIDARERLLRRWQAPLLADFLAMLWHGKLRALCHRAGVADIVVADLFAGGDAESVAPARELLALSRTLRSRRALAARVIATDAGNALLLLRADPLLGPALARFFRRFGARAMHELKLEQPSWREDPTFIVRQLQDLTRRTNGAVVYDDRANDDTDADLDPNTDDVLAADARRTAAEAEVNARLNLFSRLQFRLLLAAARTWTGHREAMRYARARAFAVLRRLALRLGDALVLHGVIDSRRDVFMLEHHELCGAFTGTGSTTNLRALVALRAGEHDAHVEADAHHGEAPARVAFARGVALGPPLPSSTMTAPSTAMTTSAHPDADGSTLTLRGTAVVRGVARGPVKIVRGPDDADGVAGAVLVCPRTDPGFAALFCGARALIVERGSPLSHCAIVARELGLPMIINVAGATSALADGVVVDVDAGSGIVTIGSSKTIDVRDAE
jgi:pyruvate,water dikinase